MARTDNKILALLGFNCTGDLGPYTLYTSTRHQLVFFARVPALNPASPAQAYQRARWIAAAKTWRAGPQYKRNQWELAARRAGLKITGYNLWVYTHVTRDRSILPAIERQTGIALFG